MAFHEPSYKPKGCSAILKGWHKCDDAGLLLITRKDGGLNGFYIIPEGFTVIPFTSAAMKWVWCALRDVSLKQVRECANQCRSILREGRDPIKEREKQKREAISNLYYLKDIAVDAFV